MARTQNDSKNVPCHCKDCGGVDLFYDTAKYTKAAKKEVKTAIQAIEEGRKPQLDYLLEYLISARNNALKNVEITKRHEKIDCSINKKTEKRVNKVSFDFKNVQVLCLNKILFN